MKHLFIDLDGVIRIWDPSDAIAIPIREIHAVAFQKELLNSVVTGKITDEEWRETVKVRLTHKYDEEISSEAVNQWSASPGRIDPDVLDVLNRSRFRDVLTLITNATSRLPRDLEQLGLNRAFRHIVNSSEVGWAKPDPRIFLKALEMSGCAASETMFVDDSPSHVQAASLLGIRSLVYRDTRRLEEFLA